MVGAQLRSGLPAVSRGHATRLGGTPGHVTEPNGVASVERAGATQTQEQIWQSGGCHLDHVVSYCTVARGDVYACSLWLLEPGKAKIPKLCSMGSVRAMFIRVTAGT